MQPRPDFTVTAWRNLPLAATWISIPLAIDSSSMVHLPTEIWARALSFLHKPPPSEEAEDPVIAQWADYSQADLARCMRVSSVGTSTSHSAMRLLTILTAGLLLCRFGTPVPLSHNQRPTALPVWRARGPHMCPTA